MLTDDEIAALGAGGFVLRDGLLGPEVASLVAVVLQGIAGSGALRPATTGKARLLDPAQRGDQMGWLDPRPRLPGVGVLFERFEGLRLSLNRGAYLGLRRFEVQLARYAGGAAYARHRDAFTASNARVATAIYYANPSWTPAAGGRLRLHLAGGALDIEPVLDRLVLFLSERVEHEVLPAHAPRLAVTAWYRRDG